MVRFRSGSTDQLENGSNYILDLVSCKVRQVILARIKERRGEGSTMSGEELLVDAVAAAGEELEAVQLEEAGDSKVSGNPAAVACFGIWSVHCDQRDP